MEMGKYVKKFKYCHVVFFLLPPSYESRVVGTGLNAQRQNPEFKVRSMAPRLEEVKKRLDLFNQVRGPQHY